jgi:hypothetical protein
MPMRTVGLGSIRNPDEPSCPKLVSESSVSEADARRADTSPPTITLPGEQVPLVAMGLSSRLRRWSRASENVHPISDRLKVGWIDASRVSAKVVQSQTIWDRSDH